MIGCSHTDVFCYSQNVGLYTNSVNDKQEVGEFTSVQELHWVGGSRGLAEGLGGDGQDPESIANPFGESGDGICGVLQARCYDCPLDGAQGLLLDGVRQRAGIWNKAGLFQNAYC